MTIEFQTEIENGTIAIPEKFRRQLKDKIKVTVSIENREKSTDEPFDIVSELMKNPMKVDKTVPFLTRDELHNRKL